MPKNTCDHYLILHETAMTSAETEESLIIHKQKQAASFLSLNISEI